MRSCALALTIGFSFALAPIHSSAQESETVDLRLQLQWQAKTARLWKVQIELVSDSNDGTISEFVDQSPDGHLANSIETTASPPGALIQPRRTLSNGGLQFRVRGSRDAKLAIRLATFKPGDPTSLTPLPSREVTLADLVGSPELRSDQDDLVETANRPSWRMTRVSGDELRIEGLPRNPIVNPNRDLNFSIRCNSFSAHASRQLTLHTSLIRVDGGGTVSSSRQMIRIDARGNSEPVAVTLQTPSQSGVYEVRSTLVLEDENIWSRIRRRDVELHRVGRPIAVLGEDPPSDDANWQTVGQLRSSDSSWSVSSFIPSSTARFIPGSEPSDQPIDLETQSYGGRTVSMLQPGQVFQATLPVLRSSIPHRIKLRMAQNRAIRLRVEIGSGDEKRTSFVITQDANTDPGDPWLEHSWVHYPGPNEQIWLTNLSVGSAAIESISVQAGPRQLTHSNDVSPSVAATANRNAVLRITDQEWIQNWSVNAAAPGNDFDPSTIFVQQVWTATQRLADYASAMKFSGLVLPADAMSSAISHALNAEPRVDPIAFALEMLQRETLQVYVAVRPTDPLKGLENKLRIDPKLLAALTRDELGHSDQYNLLDNNVQQSLAAWINHLDNHYGRYSRFAGLALDCGVGSHLRPPVNAQLDAGTVQLFAQAKGLPAAPPEQLRSWLDQHGGEMFQQWIHEQTMHAYDVVTAVLRDRPALMFMSPEEAHHHVSAKRPTWRPIPQLDYGNDEVLSQRRTMQRQMGLLSSATTSSRLWGVSVGSAHQVNIWPQWYADLSRVIDGFDPTTLVVDQSIAAHQLNDGPRRFFAALTSMPATQTNEFSGPDPTTQTVRVRSGIDDGHLYVSIVSLVPWGSEVDLETSGPIQWVAAESTSIQRRDDRRIRVGIPGGQMVVLRSATADSTVSLNHWTSRISGGVQSLERIKQQVTSIVERIGMLSEPGKGGKLRNGSFEQSGNMGLVGWLSAQHPPGCVRIDDQQAMDGKQSVLLSTDPAASSRTWIVSETIDRPASGRLAVSLACRGEQQENAPPHRLKVSIEATRNGHPIRFAKEFDVPRNGQWGAREVVLEADGLHHREVDSLRLTIDSLSAGRVWIDDVRLHERFATQQEREELQSLAFLAVQGLQRGNLAPSGRLLSNHWARHLLTFQHVEKPKPVAEPALPPPQPPGVAERLRSWLPKPLRF